MQIQQDKWILLLSMRSHVAIKWIFGDVPLTRIPMELVGDRTVINVLVLVITVYFGSLFLGALIKQYPSCEGYVALIGGCQDAYLLPLL